MECLQGLFSLEALEEIFKGILYGSPQGISRKSLRESCTEILREILEGILYGNPQGEPSGSYENPCGDPSGNPLREGFLWKPLRETSLGGALLKEILTEILYGSIP